MIYSRTQLTRIAEIPFSEDFPMLSFSTAIIRSQTSPTAHRFSLRLSLPAHGSFKTLKLGFRLHLQLKWMPLKPAEHRRSLPTNAQLTGLTADRKSTRLNSSHSQI